MYISGLHIILSFTLMGVLTTFTGYRIGLIKVKRYAKLINKDWFLLPNSGEKWQAGGEMRQTKGDLDGKQYKNKSQ